VKTKFIFILLCFFIASCSNVKGVENSQNDLVHSNLQAAVLVGTATDTDYKRVQQVFGNSTKIDWAEVKPRLTEIENSPIADRIVYLLENDLITQQTSLMAQCCGGCAVSVPHNCSMCDPICKQNEKGFFDFLDYTK